MCDPVALIEKSLQGIERKSRRIKNVIDRIELCTFAQIALIKNA
ncbi:hypothetical protein J2Z83_003388 [Virgibacillus natechei]|uniref:Transposase n=1 Tax=Virgibacillus natechei TaxID=1216297 RepID=A0ABS4IK06_9BACI|nr:hypothetical protein [Virgibacillus natechei]